MNQGFFQSTVVTQPKEVRTSCGGSCRLLRGCYSPKMPVTGQGKMRILVIAEAPGQEEDKQNIQLIGPAGQLLRDALAEFGIGLDRDCRKTNAVRCRPPENRKPTSLEISSCQSHIWEEIKSHPPKLILLLGQVALESFLLGKTRKAPGTIGRWRGFAIPDQKARAWVCPTFHPSYILRSREGRAIRGKAEPVLSVEEKIFTMDLENALGHLRKPFPITPSPNVEILQGDQLTDVHFPSKGETIAIDYETTGLRPWERTDHRIVSVGVAWDDRCFSFEMSPIVEQKWKDVLINPLIKKVGHNCKFEHQWAAQCLGVETQRWEWDTMLAAHQIDNRKHICGLKHQVYLNFGEEDWSGGINFEEDEENESGPLLNVQPTEELLRYNALDAYWTWCLYQKQKVLFSK